MKGLVAEAFTSSMHNQRQLYLPNMDSKMYKALALTVGLHFTIMYLLVFVPVNAVDDITLFNLRNLYKAMIMVAPMVFLMLLFMGSMYKNGKLNIFLYSASVLVFVATFLFIRTQAFVEDEQLIKSMIPHHSSAILMCQEADLTDRELQDLCGEIIRSQQEEIDQMNRILERLKRSTRGNLQEETVSSLESK